MVVDEGTSCKVVPGKVGGDQVDKDLQGKCRNICLRCHCLLILAVVCVLCSLLCCICCVCCLMFEMWT